MNIHTFIKKKPYLVWHTKNFEHLSNESIVENVLNYGNFADEIFGNEFNEKIFRSQLVYFKDIDYTEKVIFMKDFEVPDKIIKEKLVEFALS